MKRNILTVALAVIGIFGFNAMAQQCDKANCPKGKMEQRSPGDNNKMYQPREFTELAFEGILLDQAQQVRIDSLNAAFKANCPKGEKGCCKKAECQKQECDKANCPKGEKNCDKGNGQRKHGKGMRSMEVRKDYSAKVKEILTPEQYVVYLENISFMEKPALKKGDRKMQSPKGQKDMKMKKGERGPKAKVEKK